MKTASIFKKMAAIVAIVGAGLLAAPLEQAQAQTGIPEVTEFCIISNAASDYELSRGYLACLPIFDTSSSPEEWILGTGQADEVEGIYTEAGGGGSGYYLFRPRDPDTNQVINDGRWILVVFHISVSRNSRASLSVLVTDSEGNQYTPYDVWVSYYGWRGW